jgi:cytochrome c oxidase cbb3-type subunit III
MSSPSSLPNDPEPSDRSLLTGDVNDRLIEGHHYDGIKEYDNPMPGWWVWIFVATVVWSVFYVLGLHVFGFINSYEDDLARSQAELQLIREAYAEAHPTFLADAETLAAFVEDPDRVERGAVHYASFCAACHGGRGEGMIGPALNDDQWDHGGSDEEIYHIVTVGVPARGMPGWDRSMSAEARAEVVAFIRSLHTQAEPE